MLEEAAGVFLLAALRGGERVGYLRAVFAAESLVALVAALDDEVPIVRA
jgi:hypothetical protein